MIEKEIPIIQNEVFTTTKLSTSQATCIGRDISSHLKQQQKVSILFSLLNLLKIRFS